MRRFVDFTTTSIITIFSPQVGWWIPPVRNGRWVRFRSIVEGAKIIRTYDYLNSGELNSLSVFDVIKRSGDNSPSDHGVWMPHS